MLTYSLPAQQTRRDGVHHQATDESGMYPVVMQGKVARVIAYVWAESERDALMAVRTSPDRCPRYWSERIARDKHDIGNDGLPGERLYRVSLEVLS